MGARLRQLLATPRGKILAVIVGAAIVAVIVRATRRGDAVSSTDGTTPAADPYYSSPGPFTGEGGGVLAGGAVSDPYAAANTDTLWSSLGDVVQRLDQQGASIEQLLAAGASGGAAAGAAPQPTGTGNANGGQPTNTKPPVKPQAKVQAGFFRSGGHWYFQNGQGNVAAVSAPSPGGRRIATPAGFTPAKAAQPQRPAEPSRPTPSPTPQNPAPTKPAKVQAGFFRSGGHWYFQNEHGKIAAVAKPSQGARVIATPAGFKR